MRISGRPGVPRTALLALARRIGGRVAARRRAALQMWLWAALALWMTSPLESFLSGVDPSAPVPVSGSPVYRYAHDACVLIPVLALLAHGEAALRLARSAWPLLLFLGYAALSVTWSADRTTSLQALVTALPLAACAAVLPLALRPGRVAQALLQALALAAIGSVLAALLIPHFAVAGVHDVVGASAPGDWRGLYVHKNTLGHTAGLSAAALLSRGGRLLRPRPLRWIGLAAALLCVAMARSASGLALAAGLPLLAMLTRPRGPARGALAGFLMALAASAFAARAVILAAGLAVLGRDATLSGRTEIWRTAMVLLRERPVLGWGLDYSASPDVTGRLTALFGVDHVHNAALDVFLNLGAVGMALWIAAAAGALLGSAGPSRAGSAAARGVFGLLAVGWLLSGLTEDMGVRTTGPMAEIGAGALWSLYALRAGRRSFRRPAWRFEPAWTAPLRPPRLTGPP